MVWSRLWFHLSLSLFALLCSTCCFLSPAVIKMAITDQSQATHDTIQRPRHISKKAPYSLKRYPSDTNCYTCSFQDQAYVQRNTMYCLSWAWIPMDFSGLLLEYINLWPLRYMDCLFKRIDVGTHPTMNNTPTFLLIHLAISLLSI